MLFLAIPDYHIVPSGPMSTFFTGTYVTVAINGIPPNGYKVTLVGLIIIIVLALTANAITEKLTTKKMGGLVGATLVTIIGSYLTSAYVLLPFDFALEGVRIIAALVGAVVIAVFYNLIRSASGPAKK